MQALRTVAGVVCLLLGGCAGLMARHAARTDSPQVAGVMTGIALVGLALAAVAFHGWPRRERPRLRSGPCILAEHGRCADRTCACVCHARGVPPGR